MWLSIHDVTFVTSYIFVVCVPWILHPVASSKSTYPWLSTYVYCVFDSSDWVVAVGPPLSLSPPVIFFSPLVMSLSVSLLMVSLACFWAWAVGPPLAGSSLPVIFFSASVILEIVSESSRPVELDVWVCVCVFVASPPLRIISELLRRAVEPSLPWSRCSERQQWDLLWLVCHLLWSSSLPRWYRLECCCQWFYLH